MLLLLLNHHFYCCLTTTFTDLAAEPPLHRNLGDSLTIPRVGSRFQEQEPTRPVSSNFWTRLDFSNPKIGPESPRLGSNIRPDAISLVKLKRWIVIIENYFRIVEHVEIVRLFQCLNENVDFSSVNIIKNHIMKRFVEIEKQLFKYLFDDNIKILLILNDWATFNKQFHFEIITFLINNDWRYHDIFINFENILNRHFNNKLIIILRELLQKYNIKNCFNIIITNNVNNNKIFFENWIK